MRRVAVCFLGVLVVTGCAKTSVTPTAKNRAMITVSAAPACGSTGSANVASQMAAVATIRQGYEAYVIGGANANAQPNAVLPTGVGYSTGFVIASRNNTTLDVTMYNPGDAGYENAIGAKATLGADWETKVDKGISTCT